MSMGDTRRVKRPFEQEKRIAEGIGEKRERPESSSTGEHSWESRDLL